MTTGAAAPHFPTMANDTQGASLAGTPLSSGGAGGTQLALAALLCGFYLAADGPVTVPQLTEGLLRQGPILLDDPGPFSLTAGSKGAAIKVAKGTCWQR